MKLTIIVLIITLSTICLSLSKADNDVGLMSCGQCQGSISKLVTIALPRLLNSKLNFNNLLRACGKNRNNPVYKGYIATGNLDMVDVCNLFLEHSDQIQRIADTNTSSIHVCKMLEYCSQ